MPGHSVQVMDAAGAAEPLPKFWARAGEAWEAAAAAAHAPGGRTVAVVAHSAIVSAMLCRCLGLGAECLSLFRSAPGRSAASLRAGCARSTAPRVGCMCNHCLGLRAERNYGQQPAALPPCP